MTRAGLRRGMTHRLDVVPVRIEHKGAVVIRVIVRADGGSAVVPSACCDGGLIEGIDARAVLGDDRDVHRAIEPALAADPKVRLAVGAETGGLCLLLLLLHLHEQHVAKRSERTLVKGLGSRVVRYREAYVVDHAQLTPTAPARPAQP